MNPSVHLLGYDVFSGNKEFFSGRFRGIVNTLNPHSYIVSRKDEIFRRALAASDYLIADGIGISLAARLILGSKIHRIAGYDVHMAILDYMNRNNGRVFYLGSSGKTLDLIKLRIEKEAPGIVAEFYSPPFKKSFTEEDNARIITAINEFVPDVLFVGLTAPKQEKWVFENRCRMNTPVICSIGAVFDYYAGTVERPGRIWIKLGLEWFRRLLIEPKRLWRRTLISAPLFLWCVLREKATLAFRMQNRK